MKIIETLFEKSNFDHKNILNRSNVVIPQSILDQIEAEGLTSEIAENLGVPVFKYKTQITVHGLFPELNNNYLFGYKNLFQNKNLSIGIKYNAIDASKKRNIYELLKDFSGWYTHKNSSEYYCYKTSKYFTTKQQYSEILPEFKKQIDHINTGLFVGDTGVYLAESWGQYFLVAFITINAIFETNVIPVVENICKESYSNILNKIAEDKRLQAEKLEAEKLQRESDYKKQAEIERPVIEKFRLKLIDSGYELVKEFPLYNGLQKLSYSVNDDLTVKVNIQIYGKSKAQKKWRYVSHYNIPEAEITQKIEYTDNRNNMEYHKNVISGWILKQTTAPVKPEKKQETVITGNIQIIQYSEKSIAVIGDGTRSIKDTLKQIGGSFNFRLSCGPGWIFPKTKETEVQKYVNVL